MIIARIAMAIIIFTPILPAAAAVSSESSPFYYVDDTLENRKKRAQRKPPAKKRTLSKTAKAPVRPPKKWRSVRYLEPGVYKIEVTGIICNVCTMAVITNLKNIKGVAKAKFSFESGHLLLTIKKPKPQKVVKKPRHPGVSKGRNPSKRKFRVRFSKIRRAIRHAGRRARLGTELRVKSIEKAG